MKDVNNVSTTSRKESLKTAHNEEGAALAEITTVKAGSSFEANRPRKDLGVFVVICLGWNICNSWAGVAVTMAVSIPSGGMVTLIYGILLTTFAYICIVGTLAELASVYPTAGGQYHWTSILAPKKLSRGLVDNSSLCLSLPIPFKPCRTAGCVADSRMTFRATFVVP